MKKTVSFDHRAARLAAIYAVVAAIWIYASDALLALVVRDSQLFARLSTGKGWAFVVVTSAILYALLQGRANGAAPPADPDGVGAEFVPSPWPPLAVFLLCTLLIGGIGVLVFHGVRAGMRQEAKDELGAVADLKVRQVADWLGERGANAQRVGRDAFLVPAVEEWLARGAPEDETADRLHSRLGGLLGGSGWSDVTLLDTRGKVRLALPEQRVLNPDVLQTALQAMQSGTVRFVDLHRHGVDSRIAMGCVTPLMRSPAGARSPSPRLADSQLVVGAVVLELDPGQHLYPLLQAWPLPSASGEIVLVRSEGDSVLVLNSLRHRKDTALSLRLAIPGNPAIEARAVAGDLEPRGPASGTGTDGPRGARGSLEGIDHNGVPVLAAVREVPGTDWVMIAHVAAREVDAPAEIRGRLIAAIATVLVLTAWGGVWLWWRQQRVRALLDRYRSEQERKALLQHYDHLTRYANDIIILMDDEGRILEANDRALTSYGYAHEELLGANARILRRDEDADAYEEQWRQTRLQGGSVFETVHRCRDGTTLPVEVSSRVIDVEGRSFRQAIVRDISERKEAERRMLRLSNLYAALSQMNQAIVRGTGRKGLFEELCRLAVECGGGLKFAWVGLLDEETRWIVVAYRHGADDGYLDGLSLSTDPALPGGRGPAGTAIREGRPCVCDDFLNDPSTAPWRSDALRVGIRASAALPLTCEGKVVGVLNVYATEAGYFTTAAKGGNARDVLELLEEMAADVSFALGSLAQEERRRAAESALRESEEKYRLLFSNERDAIVLFDLESTRMLEANEAFITLLGYRREDLPGLRLADISGDQQATERSLQAVRERGFDRVAAREARRKDGSSLWVDLGLDSFVLRGRQVVCAILRDITDRKRSEERMLLWSRVLEDSAESIVITDATSTILTVNKAFTQLTGYTSDEAVGANPRLLQSGQHDRAFYHALWGTVTKVGRWQGEIWNRRKNGEVYPAWLSITAVRDEAGAVTHYLGISTDITERKESAERIQFLVSHDFLTGLPNRALMNDLIRQALANARRRGVTLALLYLDLDKFKTINESLGHHAGDLLLQKVAARLTSCVREGDTIARLGADEFLILLPELTHGQDAAQVAQHIIEAMQAPLDVDGSELTVTASIGISLHPHDGSDVASLLQHADAARDHAKELGRNNYQFFGPELNVRAFEALSMEMSLKKALERDELTLLYQPQVHAESGRMVGVEALIRWRHRDLGLVLPSQFIPIAEEHGLILPIGEWVLREACAQVRRWSDAGLPVVPVAVNVSALQFRQAGLVERIRGILAEAGLAPRFLELELTESIVMHQAERTIALLSELKEMGLALSIDDFGTGYSSLSYLRRFPIHKLKIDQSFVRDLTTDPDAAAITAAIVSMGKSLKLRIIAEGVETLAQYAALRAIQCDEVQGFLLGRPQAPDQIATLLRDGRPLQPDEGPA